MTIKAFAEKYELTTNNVYLLKHTGSIPESAFYKPKGDVLHIKESHFKRRRDFKDEMISDNQEFYWYMKDVHTDVAIARMVCSRYGGSYRGFLHYLGVYLFQDETNTMYTKISQAHWKFFKFRRYFMRELDGNH